MTTVVVEPLVPLRLSVGLPEAKGAMLPILLQAQAGTPYQRLNLRAGITANAPLLGPLWCRIGYRCGRQRLV